MLDRLMTKELVRLLACAALMTGCASGGGGGNAGTGGSSGGAMGTGGTSGAAGSGGTAGASGTTGAGGQAGTAAPGTGGQATGTAGAGGAATAGTGGSTSGSAGTGGSGATGTAGAIGTAGAGGRGGATGAAGAGGRGGATGAGGAAGTGGRGGATGSAGSGGATGTGGGSGTTHWVGTWTGAPQLTETSNNPPAALSGATLRQIVHTTLGGSQLRVRFSNEFGNGSVTIGGAHVAVCKATPVDSTIDTTTDKALAFSGSASVTIAQGKAVWSDPLDFALAPLGNLSVTTAFTTVPSNVTGHPGSRTTSYEQTGSTTVNAANMSSAMKADHWYILSGVDVMADASAKGLVILGDSITDGRGSTTNGNDRWPDDLAKKIMGNAPTANKVGVMNQGIGGNAVVSGGLGPTAIDRYMRDVLGQSGVRWVIVFESVNDLGGGASASSITAAFDSFISMAHAQGLLIYGATVTPFGSNSYYSAANETNRQTVNTYIRSGKFDGVIDFDAAVRDASTPPKLQAAYDSGDGLHLNPTGYQKMADTVDLTLLTK
jgi:lysophospholipase L1-like esterase